MANKPKGFVVVAGRRASGAPYWLVRGTRDRRQIRREFDARRDALAFAEQQNTATVENRPVDAHALTHLPLAELRQAESVSLQLQRGFPGVGFLELLDYYQALSPIIRPEEAKKATAVLKRIRTKYPDANLATIGDWFMANYRVDANRVPLRTALEHYLSDADRRHETRTLSRPQYQRIGHAMSQLENHFGGDEPLAHLTTGRLSDYLKETTKGRDGAMFSNKTWNNRRGYLSAFFEFCRLERWIEVNPVGAIRSFRKKDLPPSTPVILSVERSREVMAYAQRTEGGRLVPFFALCLFAGIRPDYLNGEISRLRPNHFNLTAAVIKMPGIITKTRRPRIVKLQPNLIRWLKAYPLESHPIICRNFRKLYLRARTELRLEHDVMRHTYCSMLVGKFQNVSATSIQAGNSESVVWGSYLNLVDQEVAERFWEIRPAR